MLAQHIFATSHISHIYDNPGNRLKLKQLLSGNDTHIWNKAMSMEIGWLAQGNDYGVTPTDTIDFIPYALVPPTTKVTYASFIADYRPLKPEPNRIRCVAGGDKLDYFGSPVHQPPHLQKPNFFSTVSFQMLAEEPDLWQLTSKIIS